jgi:hypothetical protein
MKEISGNYLNYIESRGGRFAKPAMKTMKPSIKGVLNK